MRWTAGHEFKVMVNELITLFLVLTFLMWHIEIGGKYVEATRLKGYLCLHFHFSPKYLERHTFPRSTWESQLLQSTDWRMRRMNMC